GTHSTAASDIIAPFLEGSCRWIHRSPIMSLWGQLVKGGNIRPVLCFHHETHVPRRGRGSNRFLHAYRDRRYPHPRGLRHVPRKQGSGGQELRQVPVRSE